VKIQQHIKVPTGSILIVQGSKNFGGSLECLSLADYGKEKNVKADFLGLTKPINGVPHGELMPLEKKWVITISPQYGCSMKCKFCDVPKVGPGTNASHQDMLDQMNACISIHPEVKHTDRLNLHFARMGEPTFNPEVLSVATQMAHEIKNERGWGFHPVVSTMMPRKNKRLEAFLYQWMDIKNELEGEAGLQISINTTDEEIRERDFGGSALTLKEISAIFHCYSPTLTGRKMALNFALTDAPIDGKLLGSLFSPQKFMCKITPMHKTNACVENKLWNGEGYQTYYPYQQAEESLKDAGFDVIIFVPSLEEDLGRITCGNAILSGTKPECSYSES